MKIVQVLPSLCFGDAVGNDALALKKIIRERGYETEIFAKDIDARFPADIALKIENSPNLGKSDIVMFHEAIGTELNVWIQNQKCRKVMIYHNITPPEFFLPYDSAAVCQCVQGLREVQGLRNTFEMVLAASPFNRQNLLDMGYACPVHVLPILIPFEDYEKKASEMIFKKYGDGRKNIIFVGRVVPNKCHEDIIRAFSEYLHCFDHDARLFLVGTCQQSYYGRLKEYTKLLHIEENVIFTGHINFDEILAYYRLADLFICQSEHEGFCVPLVEAMYFDIPIIAYDSSAIAWTLGGSGFLMKEKDPLETAAVMDRILSDGELRNVILQNQRERLADFQYEKVKSMFWKCMDEFIA